MEWKGLLKGDLIDLGQQKPAILEDLKNASSPVLSSKYDDLADEDYNRALEICKKSKIRFIIYMGDGGAMSTADKLAEFAQAEGYPLCCVGVPHSVENTLGFTDHCFGYGAAARANAIVIRNVGRDAKATGVAAGVNIIEVVGRNSGWLAAATALAKDSDDSPTASDLSPRKWTGSSAIPRRCRGGAPAVRLLSDRCQRRGEGQGWTHTFTEGVYRGISV